MSNENFNSGYINLSRSLIDSDIWHKGDLYLKVWIFLLMKAQHKDYKGLKRGQLFTSIPEIMAKSFSYVGARKETPSKDKIFNVIEYLRKPSEDPTKAPMITTTKATHGMLVTINNYARYQDSKLYESNGETNSKATRKQRQADNTNKNGKNAKHYNNDTLLPEFEKFWNIYDKKVGKESCIKLFTKISESDKTLIMAHLEKYIPSTPDPKYRKDPATYLKGKHWQDEIIPYKQKTTNNHLGGGAKIATEQDFESFK